MTERRIMVSGDLTTDAKFEGKPHENETAFRVSPNKLDNCFDVKKKLL